MEGYIEEFSQDYWADLPTEIAYEIISKISDLKSLLNHMQASKTFYQLALHFTRHLDSGVRMEVPLTSLAKFRNLESLGDGIILKITSSDLHLLSNLPKLKKANIVYQVDRPKPSRDPLVGELRELLQQLRLGEKIPDVNFRIDLQIKFRSVDVMIQGDRFMVGRSSRQDLFSPVIQELSPRLTYVIHPDFTSKKSLMNREFRNFLREADFGLVDPSRPPSERNFPLSDNLTLLADSGEIPWLGVIKTLELYAEYHELIRGDEIILDDLLKRYLRPAIIMRNQEIESKRGQPGTGELPLLPLDRIKLSNLNQPNFTNIRRSNFEQFDIPLSFLSDDELEIISSQIRSALQYYYTGRPFYRTDGSLSQ